MNITFEEAKTIRSGIEKLKEACLNANLLVDLDAYKALVILEEAEKKQREKNAKTIAYIQAKRKENKNYARPEKCWVITLDLPEGKKVFERVGEVEELVAKLKKEHPEYRAIKYRIKTFK